MKLVNVLPAVLLLLAAAALQTPAATIELRTGEVYIGRVLSVGPEEIRAAVTFPEQKTMTFTRDELKPLSLFRILAARSDPEDAAAQVELAALAERLGLPGHAIAHYRQAAALDATYAPKAEAAVEEVRGSVVEDLLADARARVREERLAAARRILDGILDRFPGSAHEEEVRKLLADVRASMQGDDREAAWVSEERLQELLDKTGEILSRVRREIPEPHRVVDYTGRERRKQEAAVELLESAWKRLGAVAGAREAPELNSRLDEVRGQVRGRLVEHYLALGTIMVQKEALNRAERWLDRAYALAPDSEGARRLHDLIVQARICDDWWRRAARPRRTGR